MALKLLYAFAICCFLVSSSCAGPATPAVLVELYYESYCPDCQIFMLGQLEKAWGQIGHTGILDLKLYPYGNARQSRAPDGSWNFTCQHGPKECLGNALEACIIQRKGRNFSKYQELIFCIEGSLGQDPLKEVETCVEKEDKLKWEDVHRCAMGPEGNSLVHEYGLRTESLVPAHKYVPWIVVDGVHNEQIQRSAETDLANLVCEKYKGQNKPKECGNSFSGWEDRVDISIMW